MDTQIIGGGNVLGGPRNVANASGGITPPSSTAGIKGTTTNDNAAAGSVGEYIESVVAGVSFPTSTQFGDAALINLTAGDWDVSVMSEITANGGTVVSARVGISTTTGNFSTGLVAGSNYTGAAIPPVATYDVTASIPSYRVSLAVTTPVYMKMAANYSVATPQISGRLSARRMR